MPELTVTEKIAAQSLIEKFNLAQKQIQDVQQVFKHIASEIASAHPGYHLNADTLQLDPDPEPVAAEPIAEPVRRLDQSQHATIGRHARPFLFEEEIMADVKAVVDFVLRQEDSTLSGTITNDPSDRGGDDAVRSVREMASRIIREGVLLAVYVAPRWRWRWQRMPIPRNTPRNSSLGR